MEADNSKPKNQESIAEKLLLSFNDQFVTNQNHHQSIFLQFLSAILIVLVGYGFIYANTDSASNIFDAKISKDSTSYSVFHLIGAYTICQFILTLLATIVANIGYGFRRDQKVIHKIRIKYMGEEKYKEFFGNVSFIPHNQSLFDYLPEFNRMFFSGLYVLQFLLFISLIVRLEYISLYEKLTEYKWLYCFIYLLPILWNTWLYLNFYKKYYRVMKDENISWFKIFFGAFFVNRG